MKLPTNADRAEWARQALEAFPAADNDLATNAKDLITNLCHLVRREGDIPDFDAAGFCEAAAAMHDVEFQQDIEQ